MAKKRTGAAKSGRSRRGQGICLTAIFLGAALIGLGVTLYLLHQEKQRSRSRETVEQQAEELLKENPDAEAFNLDSPEETGEKKNDL